LVWIGTLDRVAGDVELLLAELTDWAAGAWATIAQRLPSLVRRATADKGVGRAASSP
jgi:hypothetical protein